MEPPDLTLVLPSGSRVKTYSLFVTFGSPVLRAACELLLEKDSREVVVPLDVSFWGFARAIDELLPDYLRTTAKITKFNPFKKAHRDYLESLRYLCAPHYEQVVQNIPIEEAMCAFNKEGLLFCADNSGRLGDGPLAALFTPDGTIADKAVVHELLRVCVGDEEATAALQTVMGRLLFARLEGHLKLGKLGC